ncbi:unnamed protein product, partial [marine sediment metagenome]
PVHRLPYYMRVMSDWMISGEKDHNGLSWESVVEGLKRNVLAGR